MDYGRSPLVHCFLKSIDMLVATFEKDGSPSCTILGCTNAYFNYGMDPLHPDHSINCTAMGILHLPALPPFSGHVSLIHAVQTIRARVDAFQLRNADLFRRVYALLDTIQCTNSQVRIMPTMTRTMALRWPCLQSTTTVILVVCPMMTI